MDSNENNQSDQVKALESSVLKSEAVKEEPEDNENSELSNYNNVEKIDVDANPSNLPSNGQKRKSPEKSLPENDCNDNPNSIKRRRYTDTQTEDQVDPSIEEEPKFSLIVRNASCDWTSQQVLNFIRDTCGVHISKINDSREGNTDSDFQIKLNFASKEQLDAVREKLREKEFEGKLTIAIESEMVEGAQETKDERDSEADSNVITGIGDRDSQNVESPSRNNEENETESNDFHIKEDYLRSLGILPPITNWVDVTNFRCDKSELKEVLELAGRVVMCSVVTSLHRYANAMYSHPLEAVQAVSMLNGQIFYGKKLKVTINRSPNVKTLLPKGLVSVGPGLGKFGKPVRDLPDQYKRFIQGQNSAIDASLFQPDLLNRIGVTLDRDINYSRSSGTPYSQTSQTDLCTRNSADSSESLSQISHMDENQFGPIGQKPSFHNTPLTNFTGQNCSVNINSNGSNISANRMPVMTTRDPRSNQNYICPPVSNDSDRLVISSAVINPQHPVSGQIRGPGAIQNSGRVLGIASSGSISGSGLINYPGPMTNSGPISGPNPMPGLGPLSVSGPMPRPGVIRGPMSMPGPISGPGPLSGPVRVPGPGNLQLRHSPISGCARPMTQGHPSGPLQLTGPRGPRPNQMVHISIGPRVPAPLNRFPTPISPMASRPLAPSGPVQNAIRPNGPRLMTTNVQMFRSDPVTLQISNLPPNTNFLNLGHKLSELGHVVYLEFTTPGCAVVRFANPADADRCFQNYRNVLG
ncbi:uncharacterized protein LOC116768074 isoform X2 [Danaus plexippus]|uniref:uncharacterized protein LOC116768074 isoform X2 n=1 Tax=Danaus plexippus TaxID=13037 RepID=UPI002AB2DFB4|nr:uncharacterized protein LOC116768074 isoform X2 [Danaus plexippus]